MRKVRSLKEYFTKKNWLLEQDEDPHFVYTVMSREGFFLVVLDHNFSQNVNDAVVWCDNNIKDNVYIYSDVYDILVDYYWYFENPKDAMMFKLAWVN